MLYTSDVSTSAIAIVTQEKSSVKRENISAIQAQEKHFFLAHAYPPYLCRLCSSVKVLAIAIALALVPTSLV